MAIVSIGEATTRQKKVYGWLQTTAAQKIIMSGATISTIIAAFVRADDKENVKEQKYLSAAVVGNDQSNLMTALEQTAALSKLSVSSSLTVTGAAASTSQIALIGLDSRTAKYATSDPTIATVSSSGLITLVATGTATITISTDEDSNYFKESADIAVTVS